MNNLKKRRNELGFTQLEAAKKSGLSEQQYQKYEYDDREPGVRTANRIAKTLKTSTFALYPLEE